MESAISDFLHTLSVKHDQFDCSKAFDELQRYIDSYERILYTEKFEKRISGYKEEMTKEMNSQLLTLVGMFTALAFLVFGGISSLDNIFSVNGIPLLKLMIIGCIWGLCILNLIFVFLFCIGKMTKQNFKSTEDADATVFQKYPIVWWSDLLLCAILIMCSWLWYVKTVGLDGWLIKICVNSPVWAFAIGSILILGIIIVAAIWLARRTSRRRI